MVKRCRYLIDGSYGQYFTVSFTILNQINMNQNNNTRSSLMDGSIINQTRQESSKENMLMKLSQFKNSVNVTFTSPELECRICLQSEQPVGNQLIHPCKCTGSIKMVHENCIKQWIESALKKKSTYERKQICANGLKCQMCKHPIRFIQQQEAKCRPNSKIHSSIASRKFLFILLVIIFLVTTGGISYSVYAVVKYSINENGVSFYFVIALCGSCILFLIFIIAAMVFVAQFLIDHIINVVKILPYESTQIRRRSQSLNTRKSKKTRNKIMPIVEQISHQNIDGIDYTQ